MFSPDYRNLQNAARNIEVKRIPLYEHIICTETAEAILGKTFAPLLQGDFADKKEFFRNYCEFFGYSPQKTIDMK